MRKLINRVEPVLWIRPPVIWTLWIASPAMQIEPILNLRILSAEFVNECERRSPKDEL